MSEYANSKGHPYYHIFDAEHLLKCIRNPFLDSFLKDPDTGDEFAARSLIELWHKDEKLQQKLYKGSLYPTDKQSLQPIKELIDSLPELRVHSTPEAKALTRFIQMLQTLRDAFENRSISAVERIQQLEIVVNYFQKQRNIFPDNAISKETMLHLSITLKSIKDYHSFLKEKFPDLATDLIIAHLATRAIENIFSILRGKIRYPNALQFAQLFATATMQFLTSYAKDRPWLEKETAQGRRFYYERTNQLDITMEGIAKLGQSIAAADRDLVSQIIESKRERSDEEFKKDTDWVYKVTTQLRPTNRHLLIREEFNKQRTNTGSDYIFCKAKAEKCAKVFHLQHAMEAHYQSSHVQSESIIEAVTSGNLKLINIDDYSPEDIIQIALASKQIQLFVFDGEATGAIKGVADSSRIVEFCATNIINGRSFHGYVLPRDQNGVQVKSTKYAFRVHRIADTVVSMAKTWQEIYPLLREWIDGFGGDINYIVAHNVGCDKSLVNTECKLIGVQPPDHWVWVCSYKLAQYLKKSDLLLCDKLSLDHLSNQLCSRKRKTKAHNATEDVSMTFEVLTAMLGFSSPANDVDLLQIGSLVHEFAINNGKFSTTTMTELKNRLSSCKK
jgi:DNA polymerase III epsilon subunit-like protein